MCSKALLEEMPIVPSVRTTFKINNKHLVKQNVTKFLVTKIEKKTVKIISRFRFLKFKF